MKVPIAGLGSLAPALRERGLADGILCIDSSAEHAAEALRLGLVDRIVTLEEGIPEARLIVLPPPVDSLPLLAVKVLNHIGEGQTVMDMGSIKEELCEVISTHARRGRFVAAHPMWGIEHCGPLVAQADAFADCNVVLCEPERSDADALATMEGLFRTLGSAIVH